MQGNDLRKEGKNKKNLKTLKLEKKFSLKTL